MKAFKKLFVIISLLFPIFISCENEDDFTMPFRMYSSTLSQSNTGNPIETIQLNEMGLSITWTRVSTGIFKGTFAGAVDIGKTTVQLKNQEINKICTGGLKDPMTIEFMISDIPNTANYTDNFSNLVVEIKEYRK